MAIFQFRVIFLDIRHLSRPTCITLHYTALSISAPKFTAPNPGASNRCNLPVDMPVLVEVIEPLQRLLQNGGDGDLVKPVGICRLHDVKT